MTERRRVVEDVWFRDQCREFYEDATEDVSFLKAVWERIESPDRWLKCFHARLLDGVCIPYWKVAETRQEQVAWSLYGSIEAEAAKRYQNASERIERILRAREALALACSRKHEENPTLGIDDYNDLPETSHCRYPRAWLSTPSMFVGNRTGRDLRRRIRSGA